MCYLYFLAVIALVAAGCHPMNYTDQGALMGGITGAGAGAIIGDATGGNAGPGAIIGAGLGAITGSMIGNGLDEVEARNRYQIAQQMQRVMPPGGVSVNEVLSMARSGVDEELIVNHIRYNGVARPLSSNDVIALQQYGVNKNIIAALQTAGPPRQMVPAGGAVAAQPMPVGGYVYGPPPVVYGPPPPPYYYRCPPRSSVGFSFSSR